MAISMILLLPGVEISSDFVLGFLLGIAFLLVLELLVQAVGRVPDRMLRRR